MSANLIVLMLPLQLFAAPLPSVDRSQQLGPCFWRDTTNHSERTRLAFFNWNTLGRKAAEADIRRGTPKMLTFGLRAPWDRDIRQLLKEKFGVQMEGVAGCMVTQAQVDYANGYDDRIEKEIATRFGVKASVEEEAKRVYEARQKQGTTRAMP
jgi:hypothetical protein